MKNNHLERREKKKFDKFIVNIKLKTILESV